MKAILAIRVNSEINSGQDYAIAAAIVGMAASLAIIRYNAEKNGLFVHYNIVEVQGVQMACEILHIIERATEIPFSEILRLVEVRFICID